MLDVFVFKNTYDISMVEQYLSEGIICINKYIDYKMPFGDAFDFCKSIKLNNKEIKKTFK